MLDASWIHTPPEMVQAWENHSCYEGTPLAMQWRCWAYSEDWRGYLGGRWVSTFWAPPLWFYWHLLSAPVPNLRQGMNTREMFRTAPQPGAPVAWPSNLATSPGDLSLLGYLAALGPLEVIREVRRDVTLNNSYSVAMLHTTEAELVTAADLQALQAELQRTEQAASAGHVTSTVAAAAALSLAQLNPLLGVVIGIGGLVARAAVQNGAGSADLFWVRDTFGRRLPRTPAGRFVDTFWPFRIADSGGWAVARQIQSMRDQFGVPPPAPTRLDTTTAPLVLVPLVLPPTPAPAASRAGAGLFPWLAGGAAAAALAWIATRSRE